MLVSFPALHMKESIRSLRGSRISFCNYTTGFEKTILQELVASQRATLLFTSWSQPRQLPWSCGGRWSSAVGRLLRERAETAVIICSYAVKQGTKAEAERHTSDFMARLSVPHREVTIPVLFAATPTMEQVQTLNRPKPPEPTPYNLSPKPRTSSPTTLKP